MQREIYVVTSQGFPGTAVQTKKKNCYVAFFPRKFLKNLFQILGTTLYPADHQNIRSNVPHTASARHLFDIKRYSFDPENFSGQYYVSVPTMRGEYNVTQYLARLCICEVKTVQNILRGFL